MSGLCVSSRTASVCVPADTVSHTDIPTCIVSTLFINPFMSTTRAMFGYEGNSNNLKVVETGGTVCGLIATDNKTQPLLSLSVVYCVCMCVYVCDRWWVG